MRWVASLVAETFRILTLGGRVPRPAGHQGPSTGPGGCGCCTKRTRSRSSSSRPAARPAPVTERCCEVTPDGLHQRVPLIFGSKSEVERIERYHAEHLRRPDAVVRPRRCSPPDPCSAPHLNRFTEGGAMSIKHPVVAVTGSSGAGTTSVTRTFQHIFRREGITPALVEGDSFHRYDRQADEARDGRGRAEQGQPLLALRPGGEPARGPRGALPGVRGDRAAASRASTCTTRRRRSRTGRSRAPSRPGRSFRAGQRPAVLRGPARRRRHRHGRHRQARRPAGRRGADHQSGVDPEAAPRPDAPAGYSSEAVTDTILRRMPDYVNYICPQFSRTDVNFQRVPTVDTSDPVHRPVHPVGRRELPGDPVRQSDAASTSPTC